MPHEQMLLRYDLRMEAGSEDAEIMVYGGIVSSRNGENSPDVTAMDFDKLLKQAKAGGARNLTLRINSGGGSVWQAVAMRTMLMGSGLERITARVEGLCASAATLLACIPGARVQMAEGSNYMIHNPRGIVWGTASDMEKEAVRMRSIEGDVRKIYAGRCGKDDEDIKSMMDAETWMTADEAVKNGFADEVIRGAQAVASVDAQMLSALKRMYMHVPDVLCAMEADSNAAPEEENGDAAEHNEQEEKDMEIKDITMEQLRSGNPELHDQIMRAGAEAERERMEEIDALTPVGYEQMAAQAKHEGTSSADFLKAVIAQQKQKGEGFMAARRSETDNASQVSGGAAEDNPSGKGSDEQEMNAFGKEIAELAKGFSMSGDGMY
ncbi:MAG: head maturation protease, ClpP-related [Candidatus Ventricola sp.]